MIEAKITLDDGGCLKSVWCKGHSNLSVCGNNLACTAFSMLIRTLSRLLALEEGVGIEGNAPEEGTLFFFTKERPSKKIEWMRGVTDYFLQGISDLKTEYPGELRVTIHVK